MKRLAVVVALAALLACSAVASAASLSGTYQTKFGASAFGGQLKGTWTIKFSHGNYVVKQNGREGVRGKYTISGNRVSLGHESGSLACPRTGTYKYKLSGKHLKFTRVADGSSACAGRAAILSGSFTKVG